MGFRGYNVSHARHAHFSGRSVSQSFMDTWGAFGDVSASHATAAEPFRPEEGTEHYVSGIWRTDDALPFSKDIQTLFTKLASVPMDAAQFRRVKTRH